MRFSSAFLRRLEALPSGLRFRYPSHHRNEGEMKDQRRFGSGTEFAQHREFNPGDDIRHIDWNLYARFRSLYVKNFSSEDSQSVHILIDVSKSMDFGSPGKFNSALTLAAGLSLISLRGLDRVSLYLWNTQIRQRLINLRGVPSFPKIVEFLESAEPSRNTTDLMNTCRELIGKKAIPGPIWVISDFYDEDQFEHALSLLCHHRFLPLPIRILDRYETSFHHSGFYTLIDSETEDSKSFIATKSTRREFAEQFDQFSSQLREISKSYNVILHEMMTDLPAEDFLIRLLRDLQ